MLNKRDDSDECPSMQKNGCAATIRTFLKHACDYGVALKKRVFHAEKQYTGPGL